MTKRYLSLALLTVFAVSGSLMAVTKKELEDRIAEVSKGYVANDKFSDYNNAVQKAETLAGTVLDGEKFKDGAEKDFNEALDAIKKLVQPATANGWVEQKGFWKYATFGTKQLHSLLGNHSRVSTALLSALVGLGIYKVVKPHLCQECDEDELGRSMDY